MNCIIDLFPPHERGQVRTMLAGILKGIVGQRLLRTADGAGRVTAREVLVVTNRIRDFILEPAQTGKIHGAIAEGGYYGRQTYDQALLKFIEEGRIDYAQTLGVASQPQNFKLMVQSLGLAAAR